MKKQTIIIRDEQCKARAMAIIENLPFDPIMEVIIKPHKQDRSLMQNAFYWKILTIMGDDLGQTKDEIHHNMKHKFLVKIFMRDDDGYAEMVSALRAVKSESPGLAASLGREIVNLTSTTQANVKQMREYLDDIQHFASSLGIKLPAPEYK